MPGWHGGLDYLTRLTYNSCIPIRSSPVRIGTPAWRSGSPFPPRTASLFSQASPSNRALDVLPRPPGPVPARRRASGARPGDRRRTRAAHPRGGRRRLSAVWRCLSDVARGSPAAANGGTPRRTRAPAHHRNRSGRGARHAGDHRPGRDRGHVPTLRAAEWKRADAGRRAMPGPRPTPVVPRADRRVRRPASSCVLGWSRRCSPPVLLGAGRAVWYYAWTLGRPRRRCCRMIPPRSMAPRSWIGVRPRA